MAMKWTGKVVGGLLGALTLGPIGLAVGVVLGHQFDEHSGSPQPRLNSSDFSSIPAVTAAASSIPFSRA